MEQDQNYKLDNYQQSSQPEMMERQMKYAGFWIRWVANIIDGIILLVPTFVITPVLGIIIGSMGYVLGMQEESVGSLSWIVGNIVGFLISWTYFISMTYKYQATLGKKVFGLMVISDKSEKLTLGQVVFRETIGKIVSTVILLIGYIMAGFTQRKQALHDKIAGTIVIYKNPDKKFSGWAIALIVLACILPIIVVFVGIFASIVLVSLDSARGNAQDAAVRVSLSSMISDAIIYEDSNLSYREYKPQVGIKTIECSGQPIINISTDGKQMAFFMKSCKEDGKYFCANPETNLVTETAEVDESYVKSGATVCNSSDIPKASSDEDV